MNVSRFFTQKHIVGGAAVLAVTQFGASLAGLVRDRALTSTFPGLDTVDVYIAAFRPSDLLFQVLIMAGFSTVLVPLLAQYKTEEENSELSSLLSSVIAYGSLLFGVLALLCAFFAPVIAPYLVGFTGESLSLYIQFLRIALLTNFLFVAGNALGQFLVMEQRFWVYGITPILYTCGTIFGTLVLTPALGSFGPIIGTLIGAIVYVFLRLFSALHAGFSFVHPAWHPDLSQMGILMLPRMLALGALQFQLLLFDTFASGLGSGAVTINAYARNFQSVVVGVIGIALAQSGYALLSKAAAKGNMERFRSLLRKSLWFIITFTIPGAIVLVLLTPVAAFLVHLTDVLPVFGMSLTIYALSIPLESLNHVLLRSSYALKRTGIPAVCSVANGLVSIGTAWILAGNFGVYALAVGFVVGQLVQLLGLSIFLPFAIRKKMAS